MKNILKKNKGITLIALVITIIILLILAGISIMALTDSGLFGKAKEARETHIKAQLKEEIEMAIMEIQMEEIGKGNNVTLETLADEENGQLVKKLEEITVKLGNEEITGEYKEYDYTIDSDLKVKIGEKTIGIKPEIDAEVITTGNVLEGNTIEIKVTATISEGTVTITVPENMIQKSILTETDQEKVYVYTVNENGNYTVIANGSNGKFNKKTLKVNSIIDKPRISISNNIGTAITVNVENDYPEDADITYTYYLGTTAKANKIKDKHCTIEGLTELTKYTIKVDATFNSTTLSSDPLEVTTISTKPMIEVSGDFEITPLEYPILTTKRVMNCNTNLKSGDQLTIEIIGSKDLKDANGLITYYSLDDGNTWEEYTDKFTITYTGNTSIKAKRTIDSGEVFKSEVLYYKGYTYDSSVTCTGTTRVFGKLAYDGDFTTSNGYNTQSKGNLMIDEECWGKFLSLYMSVNLAGNQWVIFGTSLEGSEISSGNIGKLSGLDSDRNLKTRSVEIPNGATYLQVCGGSSTGNTNAFTLYEIWCSEEDQTGNVYSNDNLP